MDLKKRKDAPNSGSPKEKISTIMLTKKRKEKRNTAKGDRREERFEVKKKPNGSQ